MNLVRKRNSSSLTGGPAKSIRTEKPQSIRQPASHNASSPLTTEASGIVTTSKEERGLEVHGTSSPWRRSPRFKSQSLLGQVPSADLLVAEGSPGQVENEEEAVQCSPAQCPPQTEEDTDTDLVITMDERHGGGYKGNRKKGGVKRKKRAADRELGERQQEGAGPEVEIDRELDRELENKSRQHNLTTANVRNIIHEVITNEHVVAMMKAAINETETMPVFEPKMTRSKFKEVVEKGVVIPTWNISPIKKVNKEKAPQFVDIQLAEEDSSDEEYCPDEEEEDETAEDTFQESDMESTASSPRGTRGGFHRKIHTEWDDDRSCSPMQVNHSRSRHLKVEVVPMGPPPPPQAPLEFSFLEKLHAVEEELAIGPVCLEPYQPPLADGLMACRTRSKRPLRDDPEWTHWLQGIMTSDMYNDEEGDDDDDDPEYNFLAEIDEPDVEDYRNDRAVRITKKEVNQLMEELFETLTAQEQDGEGHEEEEEREEEAPALGTPTFNTPPDIPLEDPMAEVTAGRYRTVKQQLEAIRRRRALLESQGLLVPRALITKPREPPPPFTPTLSHHQRLQLQQQVQQHVQLLTQVHMLTSPVAALQSEAATTKQFLMELQMFAQRGELTQGPVEPGFTSVFRACNLQGALSLLEELRLSPIPYQELAWLFATRPVFLYPELLPHVILYSLPSCFPSLIVLGLRNLGETLQPKELLCHYLLRAKRVSQLRDHIMEKCKHTHPNNVIKVCHALQEVPGRVEEFLEVLYEFEQDGDEHTSVELFTRLKPVLNEWPELLRDFAAFLHPEQAQECGLLSEQQAFERSRHFLRQLELSFGENSSHYRKIVSVLRGPTLSPAGIKEVKSQIANLLRGHTHLQGEFWVFFNELHLRPSLQCQTENRGRGDVTNTNSTSQKSSAANKPKRCKGTKATQVKEKEGDRYTHPEPSVCAKNISLTPSGEKVILWTRLEEADRAILTACQQKGANKITFEAVSAQLGNKTANEVRERSVASLYRVAATE
uniref:GON-4-like protein n=1 Tax=Salmo trutta TaxID=8032 RepID=A0A673ZH79_SALTR